MGEKSEQRLRDLLDYNKISNICVSEGEKKEGKTKKLLKDTQMAETTQMVKNVQNLEKDINTDLS